MPESEIIEIAANLVEQGALPSHCSRHGRPAVKRADFTLQSKVRLEGSRTRRVGGLGVLGMAERLEQHARKVRVTRVKGWPLCDVCTRTRARWLGGAAVMFGGGLLLFVGSLVVGLLAEKGSVPALAGVAMAGFVLVVLSAFPFSRAGMSRVIGAVTAPEGGAVLVSNPSSAFRAELPRH